MIYQVNDLVTDCKCMKEGESIEWYVLTMRYLRATAVALEMSEEGIECFVPPKITNMLFVHSTRSRIDFFRTYRKTGQLLTYMRSRMDSQPLVVPDMDMRYFMMICDGCDAPIIMEERPKVKLGDRVRVISGPLTGIEGNVVRISKSKRVLISVGDFVWVATGYIPPDMLKVI